MAERRMLMKISDSRKSGDIGDKSPGGELTKILEDGERDESQLHFIFSQLLGCHKST